MTGSCFWNCYPKWVLTVVVSKALLPQRYSYLDDIGVAVQASLLSEDLSLFSKAAWHVLEPGVPLRWGWALDAICEHLTAITDGEIFRLLINLPPGCMKSLLVGVMWPAWEWTRPELRSMRYLGVSHKIPLATRDNMKCRRLIKSEWYQRRWKVILTSDQNAKTQFYNSDTGFRESMAFVSMTGSRGDRVILDDPLSVHDGNSMAAIDEGRRTFTETVPTRVNNDKSAIVGITQRVAEEDTSGIIISRDLGYTHLMLPMRFEKERRCRTSIGFVDPRKEDGELIFPERFSENDVKNLERTLGEYAVACQLQQRPVPRGGGMFKDKYLKIWDTDLPDFIYVIQSYDTAFTADTANDPTACTVWGVFYHPQRKINCALLLDAWDDHLTYPQLRKAMLEGWTTTYGGRDISQGMTDPRHPGRRADSVLIENKGSGISMLIDLRSAGVPAMPYNPGKKDDKVARAFQIMALYELELCYVIESKKEPGLPIKWARAFISELSKFGPGTTGRDDYCDSFTQAVLFMRDNNLLASPRIEEEEEEEDYRSSVNKRNPYD